MATLNGELQAIKARVVVIEVVAAQKRDATSYSVAHLHWGIVERQMRVVINAIENLERNLIVGRHQLPEVPDATQQLRDEIGWLREMIQYAIDGRDADLPEVLGGRAIDGCKKILRDALAGELMSGR